MKIAIDCRFWGPQSTGLGRYTQNLVENILKNDRENEYFLIFKKDDQTNLPVQKSTNKTVVLVDAPHYSFKEQVEIRRILKKIKPDIVHFPHFNVPLFLPYPFIVTIHDLIKHHFKGRETTTRKPLLYRFKYFGYKVVFKRIIKKASAIIVPSEFVKREIKSFYKTNFEKIKVVYEGVEQDRWERYLNNFTSAEKRLKLQRYKIEQPYIVYAGNVYPHKNIERLVLALKFLNKKRLKKKLSLVIVCGRDVFWRRIKKVVQKHKMEKEIQLVGYLSDSELALIYSCAQAFISASLMEGFGLPGLEAMSVDCPVICSEIDTFKEIYGQAPLYFNPKNIEDIKDKIVQFLEMSEKNKKEMITKGQEQVEKYSWGKCAKKTLKVYKNENSFSL